MTQTEYRVRLAMPESGEHLRRADGTRLTPNPATVVFEEAADGHDVLITLEDRGERPHGALTMKVVSVEVRASDDQSGVSGATLRSVKIGELVRVALSYLATTSEGWPVGSPISETMRMPQVTLSNADVVSYLKLRSKGEAASEHAAQLVDGGLLSSPQWIEELRRLGPSSPEATATIAYLYDLAIRSGQTPNKFIEDKLQMNRSTTSHWLKLARAAGAVPAATRKPRNPTNA